MSGTKQLQTPDEKAGLDQVSRLRGQLEEQGWEPGLTAQTYQNIIERSGLRSKNHALAAVATELALTEKPITLRGLFYRVVSAGWLPSTDKEHYNRLGRVMIALREVGIVPWAWLVDNLRSTEK